MWKALMQFIRWIKSASASIPVDPDHLPSLKKPTETRQENNGAVEINFDQAFMEMVLSINPFTDIKPSSFEQAILQQLDELLLSSSLDQNILPRLPAVVPQLLSSLKNDDASGKLLAEQIGRDPVLVGEVIKLANSPFYYQNNQKINSLQRAVIILGQSGLKRLIANVVMKPIFNVQDGYFSHLAKNHLWTQSECCAHACSFLARNRYDTFDAYLAGMAINIGMIVTVRILDQMRCGRETPRSIEFHKTVLLKSRKLSVRIAENWRFPPNVLDALAEQAIDDLPNVSSFGGLVYTANCLSQLHVLVKEGRMLDYVDPLNHWLGGLNSDLYLRCYAELKRISSTDSKPSNKYNKSSR